MTTRYEYDPVVQTVVEDMLRGALGPAAAFIRPSRLDDDFHGTDVYYATTANIGIQVRMRYDRPDRAPDDDITFRTTEPGMIREGRYAPLMAYGWLRGGVLVNAKLIDVYRMARLISPTLEERERTHNGDRTAFVAVGIAELFQSGSLLRIRDRSGSWAYATTRAERQLRQLLEVS